MDLTYFIASHPPEFRGSFDECCKAINLEGYENEVSPGVFVMGSYECEAKSPDPSKHFIRIRDATVSFIEVNTPLTDCHGLHGGYLYFYKRRIPFRKDRAIVEHLPYNVYIVEGTLFELHDEEMKWGSHKLPLRVLQVISHPKFNHVYIKSPTSWYDLNLLTGATSPVYGRPFRIKNKEVYTTQVRCVNTTQKYLLLSNYEDFMVYSIW